MEQNQFFLTTRIILSRLCVIICLGEIVLRRSVVDRSAIITVIKYNPQDNTHLDSHTQTTYDMTPEFKPITNVSDQNCRQVIRENLTQSALHIISKQQLLFYKCSIYYQKSILPHVLGAPPLGVYLLFM